ncbi:MAG: peptide chain release factor N(5)-glutamine methyltransferase [Saprospiraceae bacterium]
MNSSEAYREFIKTLQPEIEEREAKSIARIVFEDVFHIYSSSSTAVFTTEQAEVLQKMADRLKKQEPLQHILGVADFFGLKFKVSPAVLIPRPETEELVDWILEIGKHENWVTGLDIGTGSGCIPIVLQSKRPDWQLSGLDVSKEALAMAQLNADNNKVDITWLNVDILQEASWPQLGTFDFIVSNPPYIPHQERALMPAQVLDYEPTIALFVDDEDPLLFYREIGRFALRHLKAGGYLFFELNEFNAEKVVELLTEQGYEHIQLQQDLQGKNRMLLGRNKSNNKSLALRNVKYH